jgi:hypothetical protein
MAGKTVLLNDTTQDRSRGMVVAGETFRVEDYWDRLTGGSWMFAEGNFASIQYALRSAQSGLPIDDEVVYGKIGALGHLVHVSELGEAVT